MNRLVARRIAEEALAELRRLGFAELAPLLEDSRREVRAVDGVQFTVVCYALPDLGDAIRVVVAVDDGGRSALAPLTVDVIVGPNGPV